MSSSMAAWLLAQTAPGSDGWIGMWTPGIGDPTAGGWITVVAYFVASYLAFGVARRLRGPSGSLRMTDRPAPSPHPLVPILLALTFRGRRLSAVPGAARVGALWLAVGVVLLLLGINKQLDLQTAFTEIGRIAAREGGWYESRRAVQAAFIVIVLMIGIWGLVAIFLLSRGRIRELRPVLAGTAFLVCFVAIRAASFHHVDALLGYELGGLRMNWILELGGIVFIGWGARRYREQLRRESQPGTKASPATRRTTGPHR